ncbi:MAG: drug/metabolite transporter permease [Gammaproteobacteria bacterium]|nr:drug/metabolite transporter permease [Gammaproteobacteria bacterium]
MSSSECTTASVGTAAPVAAATTKTAAWVTPVELTLLGAIWGGSFLLMRVAAADFGPCALVEVRLTLGALVLLPFLWKARAQFTPRLWLQLAWISAINSAIPFVLFAWGAEHAPAGIGAITNSMAVMFAALVAFIFYGEQIGARRALGLLAGFVGVAVLASGKTGGASAGPAVLAGTTAALLYGIGVNAIRRSLKGVPASAVAAATLLTASLLLAPLAIYTWPNHPVAALSWLSAILLGVLCTGTAFVIYYRLIHRIGGPRAATVTYLIPLFGVIWAWLILGEALTLSMAASGALILGGVALSQQRPKSPPG